MSLPPRTYKTPLLLPLGDQGLVVVFGEGVDLDLNRRVCSFAAQLQAMAWPFVGDVVPSFTSVGIHYRAGAVPLLPGLSPYERMQRLIGDLLDASNFDVSKEGRTVEIPVCYGGEHGPDLDELSRRSGLPARELIARHAAVTGHVFMLGFAPGLPYLGLWCEAFDVPRRDTPRTRVPAGSVAIANRQCVIYPNELPGGWHLIGRTPLALFRADAAQEPALLGPGDQVRFKPINEKAFERMSSPGGVA